MHVAGVGDGLGDGDGDGDGVGPAAVAVGDGVGLGEGDGDGEGDADGEGVGDCDGPGRMDTSRGFRIGAVAEAVSVIGPPNRSPMNGVANVNGWLAVTLTWLPIPGAKFEAAWQSMTVDVPSE